MTVNAKLRKLVQLVTNSNWRLNLLECHLAPQREAEINAILENLSEIKNLVPLIESDIKALSSL